MGRALPAVSDWSKRKPRWGTLTSRGAIGGVLAAALSRAFGHQVGFPVLLAICLGAGICLALLFHIFDRSAKGERSPSQGHDAGP